MPIYTIFLVYLGQIFRYKTIFQPTIKHLEECLRVLRKNRMKLNLVKCTFRVFSGKFLGFLATQRGIEVSQEQVKAF